MWIQNISPLKPKYGFEGRKIYNPWILNMDQVDTQYGYKLWILRMRVSWIQNVDPMDPKCGSRGF